MPIAVNKPVKDRNFRKDIKILIGNNKMAHFSQLFLIQSSVSEDDICHKSPELSF
jgi:hypothetical protein